MRTPNPPYGLLIRADESGAVAVAIAPLDYGVVGMRVHVTDHGPTLVEQKTHVLRRIAGFVDQSGDIAGLAAATFVSRRRFTNGADFPDREHGSDGTRE